VLLQLLTEESKPQGQARRSAGLRRKRNERKHTFAREILKSRESKPAEKAEKAAAPAATEEQKS
jgi:hypothetical protein